MAESASTRSRDPLLIVLAVLMGLLALSNFAKPLGQTMQPESDAGFVFLGHRLHGLANAIMGPLFGLLLAPTPTAYGRGGAGWCRWPSPTPDTWS